MTREEIAAKKAKSQARAVRRAERVAENAALAGERVLTPKKRKKSPSLSKLKKILWTETSLVVRSWSPICLVPGCRNETEVAAHIVPSHEGAATRYFLPNLYPACSPHNNAERMRRGQWVKIHEEMFGAEFVTALYELARTTFQLKKDWVLEQTERMRRLRNDRA